MRFRTKLLVFNLGTIFVLALLFSLLGSEFYRIADLPAQERSIRSKLGATVAELSERAEIALATDDRAALVDALAPYSDDPDFVGALIWSHGGDIVATAGQVGALSALGEQGGDPIRELGDGLLAKVVEVDVGGELMGRIGVVMSIARVQSARSRIFYFAMLLLCVLGLAAGASIWLSRKLTAPILEMTRVAQRIAEGRLDQGDVRPLSRDEIGDMAAAFSTMVGRLRELAETAREVSAGNLEAEIAGRGDLQDVFRRMLSSLQSHSEMMGKTAQELSASAAELLAVAKETENNAADEASAVDETRSTMQALVQAAAEIAQSASRVAESAERSTSASNVIGERIIKLSTQAHKIRQIAETIRGIAEKSDMLALNASLEGSKGGETGRGFVLLGGEMRRLAESVTTAANQVGNLATEIGQLSQSAVLSTEEGQKVAGETLEAARVITMITEQQRTATEQVQASMDEIQRFTRHSLAGAKEARATADDLVRTSEELQRLVNTERRGLKAPGDEGSA